MPNRYYGWFFFFLTLINPFFVFSNEKVLNDYVISLTSLWIIGTPLWLALSFLPLPGSDVVSHTVIAVIEYRTMVLVRPSGPMISSVRGPLTLVSTSKGISWGDLIDGIIDGLCKQQQHTFVTPSRRHSGKTSWRWDFVQSENQVAEVYEVFSCNANITKRF